MKRFFKAMICAWAVLLLLGASMDVQAAKKTKKKKVKVKSVSVTNVENNNLYIAKGKKFTIKTKVSVTPNKAANKKVTYTVKNKKIAKVSNKGVMTGKKVGSTKITVKSKKNTKKKATFTVNITEPIKSLALDNPVLTLPETKTAELKPIFTPDKNIYDKITWVSNNEAVATVSDTGVVTAVAPGAATITATTNDGTALTATCNVAVEPLVNIESLTVFNPERSRRITELVLRLSNPKPLKKEDIKLEVKQSVGAAYNRSLKISGIETLNNKDYIINLEEYASTGDLCRISVSGINGENVYETYISYPDPDKEVLFKGEVGDRLNYGGFNYISFNGFKGYITYTIKSGKLPEGLELKLYHEYNPYLGNAGSYFYVEGIVKEVADNERVVISATDENGNTAEKTLVFAYGDSNTIVGTKHTIGDRVENQVAANKSYEVSYSSSSNSALGDYLRIYAMGGSGTYDMELVDDYNGAFSVEKDAYEKDGYCAMLKIHEGKLAVGTYTPTVKFTDENGLVGYGSIKVIVTESVEITNNIISDSKSSFQITYQNVETGKKYYISHYSEDTEPRKLIIPVGTYRVFTGSKSKSYADYKLFYLDLKIDAPGTYTYNVNYYKIGGKLKNTKGKTVESTVVMRLHSVEDPDLSIFNRFSSGSYHISNLLPGTYYMDVEVEYKWSGLSKKIPVTDYIVVKDGDVTFDIVSDDFVDDSKPEVVGNLTDVGEAYIDISKDNAYKYIKFVPATTGSYIVKSVENFSTGKMYVGIYDSEGYSKSNTSYSGDSFRFKCDFTAGKTYYIGIQKSEGAVVKKPVKISVAKEE